MPDLTISALPAGTAAGSDEVPVNKVGVTTKVTVAGVPLGVICMWGGLLASIPAGWQLCNGTNGTPDLRDRFVKGAAVNPGATGGSVNHTHAAHTGVVNHTHVQQRLPTATGAVIGFTVDTSMSGTAAATGVTTANPAGGVASLTHDTPNSEPPYYVLAFIQKVA